MAWAQFRTAAAFGQAPEQIVNAISNAIADGQSIPVRLFVGQLDLTTGLLRYCNAGNNTPLLTDEEISLLPIDDTAPAGSQPGTVYTAQETTIAPGKLLFLYTDGIAEAKDADGKILWSWHIWIPKTAFTTGSYDGLFGSDAMSRNLGALEDADVRGAAAVGQAEDVELHIAPGGMETARDPEIAVPSDQQAQKDAEQEHIKAKY